MPTLKWLQVRFMCEQSNVRVKPGREGKTLNVLSQHAPDTV